jgi:hypothetical protein
MPAFDNPEEITSEELSERGLAIYDAKLKPLLEPQDNNRFVAIHVDTEDYATARFPGAATRLLLSRHAPDGRIVVRRIGSEPEYGLAARIMAGAMRTSQQQSK